MHLVRAVELSSRSRIVLRGKAPDTLAISLSMLEPNSAMDCPSTSGCEHVPRILSCSLRDVHPNIQIRVQLEVFEGGLVTRTRLHVHVHVHILSCSGEF